MTFLITGGAGYIGSHVVRAMTSAGERVVVLDVLPGLVRTDLTLSMPVWDDVTAWDDASATATVVADIACGSYDDRHGQVLDAPALAGGA